MHNIETTGPAPAADRCSDPGTPQFAQRRVSDPSFRINTRIEFTCESGYTAQGRMTITCTSNGQWDSQLPVCVRGAPSQCV